MTSWRQVRKFCASNALLMTVVFLISFFLSIQSLYNCCARRPAEIHSRNVRTVLLNEAFNSLNNSEVITNENKELIKGSAPTKANSTIAILTLLSHTDRVSEYNLAQKTVSCYAKLNNYKYELIATTEMDIYKNCNHSMFYFRRHCATAEYLKHHEELEWILLMDADIGVINPDHRIEEYIDPTMDIIFYNRIFNHEIMAGSILIRNTNFTRDFLNYWADYNYKISTLPDIWNDNSALHAIFMDYFANTTVKDACSDLFQDAMTGNDVYTFIACCRHFLGFDRIIFGGRVKVFPKGQGWARDSGLTETIWSPKDFMFHGWKTSTMNQIVLDPWSSPFLDDTFDINRCHHTANQNRHVDIDPLAAKSGSNWKYNNEYVGSDEYVSQILRLKIRAANKRRDLFFMSITKFKQGIVKL